jgi:hypothetical protein
MDEHYDFEATSKSHDFMFVEKLIHWLTEQKIDVIADSQTAAGQKKQLCNFRTVSVAIFPTTQYAYNIIQE